MAIFVNGSQLSGGGGGRGEELWGSFDFATDSNDYTYANQRRWSVTNSNMFSTDYPSIRVILEDVSTNDSRAGTSKFGFGGSLRKSGSTYPSDHDSMIHGAIMSIGRKQSNGGGSSNYSPSGAAFQFSDMFYRLAMLDFVMTYTDNKQPTAHGTYSGDVEGLTTSSAHYQTSGVWHYNGLENQVQSGSWSGRPDTFMIGNPSDNNTANRKFSKGRAYVFGIPK